jgi:hypothetical protein
MTVKLAQSHLASIVLQTIILISSVGISAAATITPATWDGEVGTSANGNFIPVSNSSPGVYLSQISNSFGTAGAALNASSLPNPSLSASITLSTPGTNSQSHAQAFMALTYFMSVNGTGNGIVPVDVSSYGNVSMSGVSAGGLFSQAGAVFEVSGSNPSNLPLVSQDLTLNDPGYMQPNPGGASNYSVAQLLYLQVGTVYSIYMSVDVAAEIGGAAANQVLTAFVDPVFTIDPGFTGANGFSLQFSDGIGNSPSTTPLPSTWLMLLSGFVSLSLFTYRGTKKNAVALTAD